jgi:uridine kinase
MDYCGAITNYREVFHAVEKLRKRESPCIVAIDGMCGSGKSFLADLLAKTFDSNVFHMDDYFLPPELRTNERLTKPGGNVHYERFQKEILEAIIRRETVVYRPYLCGLQRYGEESKAEPKELTIIEGAYCLHPKLREYYSLKIFLSVDDHVQLERIVCRNGEEKLEQFVSKWIPLENLYFDKLGIKDLCDIVVDTTDF